MHDCVVPSERERHCRPRALLASGGFAGDAAVAPLTAGREGAPVRQQTGRLPVVVFSHGAHGRRAEAIIVVQELASHGYAVVTVDHTYDAFSVFPDGRLTVPVIGGGRPWVLSVITGLVE
ncbi:alpha/beta hydrolase [Micromonospora sp. IBHARD004]|uniref:alpha/beta hydrolase n=1 Tax=Micromonospora sp. IBHARD004 TaxID=3457764 RepID=UPI0040597963